MTAAKTSKIEYYIKLRQELGQWKTVRTCETSEQAVRDCNFLNKTSRSKKNGSVYVVFYSSAAIRLYGKQFGRRLA